MFRQSQAARNLHPKIGSYLPLNDNATSASKLIRRFAGEDERSREHTARQLVLLGKSALQDLSEAMSKTEDQKLRAGLSLVIGKITDKEVIPILQKLRDDDNIYVRWNATAALGRLGVFHFPHQRQR